MRNQRHKAIRIPAPGPSEPGQNNGVASSSAIILAALPHLLFAILTGLSAIFVAKPTPVLTLLGYAMLAGLIVAFLLAWRQGWPLWSGSWAGYWLMVPLLLSGSLLPDWPGVGYLLPLVLLVAGVLIFQRRPLYGLLASSAPLLLLTRFFVFELVAGGEWVLAGLWLLLALATGTIVRMGSLRTGVLLFVGLHVVAGLAFATGRSYLPFRFEGMGARQTPELETLVNDFAPPTLAIVAALLAFLLLHPLRQLAVRSAGRNHSRTMLLLGMVLTLGSIFALRVRPRLQPSPIIESPPITAADVAWLGLALGLALSLVSALLLARNVWSDTQRRFQGLLLPLLSAFAPLVVFALAQPFAPVGRYSTRFQLLLILSYAGVVAWTLLALLILVWKDRVPESTQLSSL